jgi:chorismate dehydratase
MPDSPLTIAAVRYLNTVPLIHALDQWSGCRVVTYPPAEIAPLVLDGSADLGLISIIDAARHPGKLTLVPGSMIGCDGPTLTVRVFSRVPPPQITRVHADTESHTSVVLADLVLDGLHSTNAQFIDSDVGAIDFSDPSAPETVLMIGDKVITSAPSDELYPHQIDLGEAWKSMTNLPFVYAAWMCRSEQADDPRIHLASSMLDRVYRRNLLRLDHLITTEAARRNWPLPVAQQYISELLRFEITNDAQRAASLFLSLAAERNHVAPFDPVWIDTHPAGAI